MNKRGTMKKPTVVVFGTGIAAAIFLEWCSDTYDVRYCVDNNKKKWGSTFQGYAIKDPNVLTKDLSVNTVVVAVQDGMNVLHDQLELLGVLCKARYYKELKASIGSYQNAFHRDGVGVYYQPPAGNTECAIGVYPYRIIGGLRSVYEGLSRYKIKGWGRGISAVSGVLDMVCSDKLKTKARWKEDTWRKSVVFKIQCELRCPKTGKLFSGMRPKSLEDISVALAHFDGTKRKNDIVRLMKTMEKTDIDAPLYVSGAFLNYLGAKIDARSIYMLDGARRIVSAVLQHKKTIDILLIVTEDEVSELLDKEYVQRLIVNIQNQAWFNAYQSIPLLGVRGERSTKRFDLIDWSLFQGATVADFGCNIGQMCLTSYQAGAKKVIGFEGMRDTFQCAKDIKKILGLQHVNYARVDFNSPRFEGLLEKKCGAGKFDYSFFLSVYRTKELKFRDRLFHYIIKKTRKGIFFEGHANPKIDTLEYYDWLFETFGLHYTFLGYGEKRIRPLFFLYKK